MSSGHRGITRTSPQALCRCSASLPLLAPAPFSPASGPPAGRVEGAHRPSRSPPRYSMADSGPESEPLLAARGPTRPPPAGKGGSLNAPLRARAQSGAVVETDLYNIVVVSVAFLVLFTAYNSLQGYVTSLLPGGLGNTSLAVLYSSVCVFVFVAPPILRKLGHKTTMLLGAVLYVVYMASLIKINTVVVLIASVVIGFGAAILWVAQNAYLIKCSVASDYGRNAGLFWGIFQFSNVIGNILSFTIFKHVGGGTGLFIAFTVIGAVGVLALMLLRPPRRNAARQLPAVMAPMLMEETVLVQVKRTLKFLAQPEMVMLAYIIVFSGFELAFWAGEFPQLLKPSSIGAVLTCVGLGEIVGGFIVGPMSDFVGRTSTLLFGCLIYCAALAMTWLLKCSDVPAAGPMPPYVGCQHQGVLPVHPQLFGASWVAYITAVCFGVADSVFNTQIISLLGLMYTGQRSVISFTCFQLYQNVGSALGFILGIYTPLHGPKGTSMQVWLQVFLIAVGALGFVYVDWKRQNIRIVH